MAIASGDVVTEDLTGRRRQRHQTRLAELGAADRQHPILQIDILKLKTLSWAGMAANPAMGSGCVDLSHCDARKYPHIAESLCPMCWLNISRLLRPRKRQCRSDVGGAMLLHERNEIAQSLADFLQLESQSAPHAQILLNGLTQRCHRAPPGQGNASVRSALISIFA